jgi:uncharacterized delta-60 repeat protein
MTRTLVALLAAALSLSSAIPAVAHARAGQPDPRFATAGTQTVNAKNADAVGGAVLALSNGRVLAGGAAAGKFVVLRLHSKSGRLDNNFGHRGQFIPALPGTSLEGVRALATFRDGRIVAAGTLNVKGGAARMVAVRLLPNGEVDPSFGGGHGYVLAGPDGAVLGSMAMDSGGNIVLAGARPGEVPLVVRLLPDGTVDPVFGAAGTVDGGSLGLTGRATGVLARPDGTVIFTVGAAPGSTGSSTFTVVRLLVSGAPDPAFAGGTGVARVARNPVTTGDGLGAAALALGPSGTLLVAGTELSSGGTQQVIAARLHRNGTIDTKFGTHGFARIARAGRNLRPTSLARDSAGRILIAGIARSPRALIIRLRPGGRRDTHFGTRGVTFPVLGRPGGGDPVWSSFQGVDAVGGYPIVVGTAAGPGPLIRSLSGTTYAGHFALTVSRLR